MFSSSPSRAFVLVAALAAGCLASLFVQESATQTFLDLPHRQLRHRRFKDPKTVEPREATGTDAGDASASWWTDIDYDEWSCGRFKCFFRSVSDPGKGYLISDRHSQGAHIFSVLDYIEQLKSEFHIRHFLLGRPYITETPAYFVERLVDKAAQDLVGAKELVIEENISAPPGALFKCRTFEQNTLDHFIENGGEGLEETLMKELADTKTLVEAHPELAWDFQIWIDLAGRVYHLDFDRTFRRYGKFRDTEHVKTCLDEAIAYIGTSTKQSSFAFEG